MYGMKYVGLLAVAPASVLLTISYFLLLVNSKHAKDKLKVFGYVVAVLLWIAVAVVISLGAYKVVKGKPCMMEQMMKQGPAMEEKMPMHMRGR